MWQASFLSVTVAGLCAKRPIIHQACARFDVCRALSSCWFSVKQGTTATTQRCVTLCRQLTCVQDALERRGDHIDWSLAASALCSTLSRAQEKMQRYAARKYVQLLTVAYEEVRVMHVLHDSWQTGNIALCNDDQSQPAARLCSVSRWRLSLSSNRFV